VAAFGVVFDRGATAAVVVGLAGDCNIFSVDSVSGQVGVFADGAAGVIVQAMQGENQPANIALHQSFGCEGFCSCCLVGDAVNIVAFSATPKVAVVRSEGWVAFA
jgi:hypothetical protein